MTSTKLQPTIFYIWQKQFFENSAVAFIRDDRPQKRVEEVEIQQLEAKLIRRHEVLSELMEEHIKLKKRTWGALTGGWVPHDTRDDVVDYTKAWSNKAEIPMKCFMSWLVVSKSKFYNWVERYGKANEHNAQIPRDFWLACWEREAIIKFAIDNPLEGYRRLTFMMLDQNVVAVSPSSTWRIHFKSRHASEVEPETVSQGASRWL